MDNYYEILGVAEGATPDDIKKAYRKLASTHHPDKGGDTATFQKIQAAYAILSDDNKRANYDEERRGGFRHRFHSGQNSQANARPFPPGMEDILRGFGFGFSGDQGVNQPQPKRNRDIRISLHFDLEETLTPQRRQITVKTSNKEQLIDITIPQGASDGSTVKYTGLGDDMFSTLPKGDLYVGVVVNRHPIFQVHGQHLLAQFDINALNAIIGNQQHFTTLDGKTFELTIPPGTQQGTKFKVAGQGLYQLNQSTRGDLLLIANIIIPTNLTEARVQLVKQLLSETDNATN